MKKIEFTIEHVDPYRVELTNEKGDTFGFNPHEYEEFNDFLSGAKELDGSEKDCPQCC